MNHDVEKNLLVIGRNLKLEINLVIILYNNYSLIILVLLHSLRSELLQIHNLQLRLTYTLQL